MQKTLTKILILGIILTTALGVNYLFAAWTGPTQAPTGGNTSTPVHIGTTDQVKDGGLSLDGLSVFGGGYFQGSVGVGVVTPKQKLDVDGGIEIGNTTTETAGAIRWTGTDFEGYNGSSWVSLVSGEAVVTVDPAYTDCLNSGGSWIDSQSTCYFNGSSCPSGWSTSSNYSSTQVTSCSSCAGGCTTGSHYRTNTAPEICGYTNGGMQQENNYNDGGDYIGVIQVCHVSGGGTCTATKIEIGCTKN
ncbi:MAG: hypothetical protein ISR98_01640 [Parcubacteria group bacterium]|nr:hypothetical protein [Parcubacteria group bacterium]